MPVTRRRPTVARPVSLCRAGTTNISKETYAETGLPGRVKIGVPSSPITPNPWGLPGCIATSRKSTVPSSLSTSLTTSWVPLLTPPLVTTRSARASWSPRASVKAAGSSELARTR